MNKTYLVSKENYKQDYKIDKETTNLAIVFGPQNLFSQALTVELKRQDPKITVLGLGTSNCFTGSTTGNGQEMSLSIMQFKKTKLKTICLPNKDYESSLATAEKIAEYLKSHHTSEAPLKGVLLFAEGLQINGADLPRPFESLGIPVCGGLAAEVDFKFQKTQVFFEGEEMSNQVIGVGFYGHDFEMESFATSGMKPVGIMKKITKSDKNVLHMVEDQTALEWYLSYLVGNDVINSNNEVESSKALAYPVSIFKDGQTIDGAIRTPIGFIYEPGSNNKKGSISFTGEIPEGHYLKMMLASPQELLDNAEDAVTKISDEQKDNEAIIHISCSARQLLLGTYTPYEYSEAKNCIGGYVYGEIATLNNKPALLNQTFTSFKIKESA